MLSFRAPALLRYQFRLGEDEAWSEVREPVLHLAGLGAGDHRAEMRASLDGEAWSDPPARLLLSLARPWYARWWAVATRQTKASAVR